MTKKTVRIVLDTLLSVMIVFEMFIQYTGAFLHEVIGFAFFATIAVHLILSAKWMKGTARVAREGKLTGRRRALAIMGCLLGIATLVLALSSIAISGILEGAGFVWPFGEYVMWVTLHGFSAYALCALVVVHLAMHWGFIASAFKVPYDPSRRRAIGAGVSAVAAVGAVALGVAAAKELVPQRLIQEAADVSQNGDVSNDVQEFCNVPDIAYESTEADETDVSSATPKSNSDEVSGKHRKHAKNGRSDSSEASGTSVTQGEESTAEEAPESQDYAGGEESQEGESYYSEDDNVYENAGAYEDAYVEEYAYEESVIEPVGICTLCRKQCSLSAPRCNRPYEAGLI